jgi:protein O-GlcNAc transferase
MHKEAIYECRKLVRMVPNDADSFIRLGYQCDEGGQTSKAIRYYRFALKKFPDYAHIYTNLGFCYERYKKRPDLALVCYEKAFELDPTEKWALNNMGSILDKEGKRAAALRYYKKAWHAAKCQKEQELIITHNLGWAYYRAKRYLRARALLERLQKIFPDNEAVCCDLGIVNYRIGQYGRAWDQFSRVLSMKPDSKHYRRLYRVAQKKVVAQ